MKCMDIQARSIVVITTRADFQIKDQGKISDWCPDRKLLLCSNVAVVRFSNS